MTQSEPMPQQWQPMPQQQWQPAPPPPPWQQQWPGYDPQIAEYWRRTAEAAEQQQRNSQVGKQFLMIFFVWLPLAIVAVVAFVLILAAMTGMPL